MAALHVSSQRRRHADAKHRQRWRGAGRSTSSPCACAPPTRPAGRRPANWCPRPCKLPCTPGRRPRRESPAASWSTPTNTPGQADCTDSWTPVTYRKHCAAKARATPPPGISSLARPAASVSCPLPPETRPDPPGDTVHRGLAGGLGEKAEGAGSRCRGTWPLGKGQGLVPRWHAAGGSPRRPLPGPEWPAVDGPWPHGSSSEGQRDRPPCAVRSECRCWSRRSPSQHLTAVCAPLQPQG